MEAIKPGSCQEELVVSRDSEDKDENPYDSVDVYDYALPINFQPPVPSMRSDLQEHSSDHDPKESSVVSEKDEHLYDEPNRISKRSSMPLPHPPPIAHSVSPPDSTSLHNVHQPQGQVYQLSEYHTENKVPVAASHKQMISEQDDTYEHLYDDVFIPETVPLPPQQESWECSHPIPSPHVQPIPLFRPCPPTPPTGSCKEPPAQISQSPIYNQSTPSSAISSNVSTSPLQQVPSSVHQKSAFLPQDLSSLSLGDISYLTQNEVQIWMLLQMQKLVQKMEDVYETVPETQTSILLPGKRSLPNQPQESREETAADQPMPRGDFYVNIDDLDSVLSDETMPPLPPKTYKGQSSREHETTEQKKLQKEESHVKNVYSEKPQSKRKHIFLASVCSYFCNQ